VDILLETAKDVDDCGYAKASDFIDQKMKRGE
jgi:hypothetical protein